MIEPRNGYSEPIREHSLSLSTVPGNGVTLTARSRLGQLTLMLLAGVSMVSGTLIQQATAGPNAGGVLLIHTNSDPAPPHGGYYDGGLAACSAALTQAPGSSEEYTLCFVYAAFPSHAAPGLRAVSFSFSYDPLSVEIWTYFPPGSIVFTDVGFPAPGTSVIVYLPETMSDTLTEVCCLEAWGLAGSSICVTPSQYPDWLGSFGNEDCELLDPITAYGSLGFGLNGTFTCPTDAATACCLCDPSHSWCEIIPRTDCDIRGGEYAGEVGCVPHPCPLIADFRIAPTSDPVVFRFEDTSTGTVTTRSWDFGDGDIGSGAIVEHTYREWCSGNYTVQLTVDTENGCSDTASRTLAVTGPATCDRPKVVLALGKDHAGEDNLDQGTLEMARTLLEADGWAVVPCYSRRKADLLQDLSDPCVRGVYITAHGCNNGILYDVPCNPATKVEFADALGNQAWVTPEEVGEATQYRRLEFITVNACDQEAADWTSSANVALGHVSVPIYLKGRGSVVWQDKSDLASPAHRGTNHGPCTGLGDPRKAFGESDLVRLSGLTGCPSFKVCDDGGCGSQRYPSSSCAITVGVPDDGTLALVDPAEMFSLGFYFPGFYGDSVACWAGDYVRVPGSLMYGAGRPLGRHLVYSCVPWEVGVRPDSVSIVMRYRQAEVDSLGLVERLLYPCYMDADSGEYNPLACVRDTLSDEVRCTAPGWGIVGLYELAGGAEVVEHSVGGGQALDMRVVPNPSAADVQLSLRVSHACYARLLIVDCGGRVVRRLADYQLVPGTTRVTWDGRDDKGDLVASGVYLCRVESQGLRRTCPMVRVR